MRPASFPFPGAAEIIAHRGFSARAPENTLAAIEAAVAARADAVEFDVHTTADGVPVVFHDSTLERTTNAAGPIRERTLAQLQGVDAGRWFSPDFAGEPIPTVAKAFASLRGRIGRVYPEVKGYRNADDLGRMLQAAVDAELLADTVFISMDWSALDRMRALHPDVNIAYIVEKLERSLAAISLAAGDPRAMIDFDARILLANPALVERAHANGVQLAVWTVDDPAVASRLYQLGVRRITSNRVDHLVAWKAAL